MNINKEDALNLVKALHGTYFTDKSNFQAALEELKERLEDFLILGEEEQDEEKDCCDNSRGRCCGGSCDEEEEDYDVEEEDDACEEEEDSSDEEDEEDAEEDNETEEEDEEEPDVEINGEELHDLKSVASKEGTLEFEYVHPSGHTDVLVDSYSEHDVVMLRRTGKELHVKDSKGNWHVYNVAKFLKSWTTLIPVNELIEVI